MNADERMKNYHWSESDISEWAREKIKQELIKRKYEIISMDIFVKICSRMNSLGLVYIISMDTILNNKTCALTNFTTTHAESEGLTDFPWFLDFFKELEGQALLQFSKNVIDLDKKERSSVDVPKIQATEKKVGTFLYESLVNCPVDEFKDFLIKKDFIQMWARGLIIENGEYKIGRISFKIKNENEMDFKLSDWDLFTEVKIDLKDLRGSTKIELRQEGIPMKDLGIMKGLWRENIFMPICMAFGFTERQYEE